MAESRGPGRPKIEKPETATVHRLVVTCTDAEWSALLAALEPDTRKRYEQIRDALVQQQ